MKNTKFMNASGLPDPQHYSTARDLHLLAAALIRDFPEQYAQYYSQKEYRYNNITQPNRNRLLWLDPTRRRHEDRLHRGRRLLPDRLVASAAPRRLLSVLLGSTSEATRAQESQKLLNWGFQFFDACKLYGDGAGGEGDRGVEGRGARGQGRASSGDLVVTVPKGQARQAQGRARRAAAAGGAGRRGPARRHAARHARRQAARRVPGGRARGVPAAGFSAAPGIHWLWIK